MNSAKASALFLDRDGVLNELVWRDGRWVSPRTVDEFRLIDGVAAYKALAETLNLSLFVATNQPDISRGRMNRAELDGMLEIVHDALDPVEMLVCPHDDSDGCDCRKPKPGLLIRAAATHGLDLSRSWLVGDSSRDSEAARAAGCRFVGFESGANNFDDGINFPLCKTIDEVGRIISAADVG